MIIIKVIYPSELKYLKEVRLNKDGPIIGYIVTYRHRYYYLSRRAYSEKQDHVFRMFNGGFGLDKTLFKAILKGDNKLYAKVEGIIILYDGKKEKRYFYASLDTWFENAKDYSTRKEKDGSFETYGEQKILEGKYFEVLGLHPDDHKAKEMLR